MQGSGDSRPTMKKRGSGSEMMRGSSILKIKETDRAEVASQANCLLRARTPKKAVVQEPSPVSSEESLSTTAPVSEEDTQVAVEEILDPMYFLPYFNSAMFATILEDTLAAFQILAECNSQLRIWKTKDDMDILRSRKHGVVVPPATDELQNVDPTKLNCDTYKLNKLEADRKFMNNLLVETYKDLSLKKGFHYLVKYVEEEDEHEQYIHRLIEEETKNRTQLRESRRQLRQQRIYFRQACYDTTLQIENLILQIEDDNNVTTMRCDMMRRWQLARAEQHAETIRQKETAYLNNIENNKYKYEHEQRAHSEMELIINILIDEALTEVGNWMEKYERDMEAIDLQIQIKKSEYQDVLDKRMLLEHTIEHRTNEMEKWTAFKIDREKKREHIEKMHFSAMIVQAWWRGMLVRHMLGPFRPRRGKGKGGRRRKSTLWPN